MHLDSLAMFGDLSIQQEESNKGGEHICGYYLKNLCANGDKCQSLHPPYLSPYCWYYQIRGENEVSLVPQEVSDEIEKKFQTVAVDC